MRTRQRPACTPSSWSRSTAVGVHPTVRTRTAVPTAAAATVARRGWRASAVTGRSARAKAPVRCLKHVFSGGKCKNAKNITWVPAVAVAADGVVAATVCACVTNAGCRPDCSGRACGSDGYVFTECNLSVRCPDCRVQVARMMRTTAYCMTTVQVWRHVWWLR